MNTESVKEWLFKYILVVTLFLGILFLFLGYTDILPTDEYIVVRNICKETGAIIIAGGVFASIVKSSQFSGIFSDLLRNIVYCTEHLEKRKDLELIWEKVSKALCRQKFKDISDDLHNSIKANYLPIDHEYYYKDHNVDIDIEYDAENPGYVFVTESLHTTIISDDTAKIPVVFKGSIPLIQSERNLTTYELTELKVNGKDQVLAKVAKVDRNSKELTYENKIECAGSTTYKIIKKEKKRYSLKANPYRGQNAIWLYDNYAVEIIYPKEISIEFLDMGVLKRWHVEKKHNAATKRLKATYEGLIFRKQGFLILFREKL